MGGGIYSDGALTLDGCTLQNNQALGGAGSKGYFVRDTRDRFGSGHVPASNGGDGLGGALCVAGGTASLRNCNVTGNDAQGGPAGGGNASDGLGEGGGIYIFSTASVSLDTITYNNVTNNTASTSGPQIYGPYTIV
jgi:hypothetical protein